MLQGILKHPILLGIAVLALIGVSLLWAQEGPPPEPPVIVIDPGAGAPPPPPGQPGPSGQPGSGLTTAPSAPPPPRGTPGVLGQAEVRYPPSTRPTSNQVKFKFENPTVDSVLNYLADVAGYIVVKESPVSGRINAVSPQPLTPQETIEFLNTALKTADMTAIQQGRTLIITTFDKAKHDSIPVRYVSEPELVPDTDEVVTYVIPLSHVDATKLKQDLTPLIGTDADVAANASSNMLIITDRSARVRRVVQMTHFLDAKDPTISDLKMVQLKYADATSAAKLINTVFAPPDDQTTNGGNAGGGGGRNGGGGGGGRGGGGGGGGGGPGAFFRQMMGQNNQSADKGGPNNRVNAVADDRTNTVVVTGPTEGVTMAYSLLTKLDSNPSAEQTFFIYALKNGSSDKLAVVLNTLFGNSTGTGSTGATSTQRQSTSAFGSTSGSSGFGGSSGGLGGSGGSSGSLGLGGTSGGGTGIGARAGTTSTGTNRTATGSQTGNRGATSELTGQVFVVSNPDTNSLLVTTASKYADQVKQIIHELDRAVPQVLIKVLIAEVTHDRSDDLGADFSVLNVRPSGNGTTLTQQLGNAAAFTANGGLSVAVVEKNVTATLHALSQQDKLDVLSRPYILTSDNQEATITIGNEVPFITNTRETDTGQTINTIQYQDIGIILDVTPHINQDGLVIMDVTPEISEQTGNGVSIAQGVTAPIFSKRSASSRVGIADGQTIVIGGLMQDQKTTTITKVPLLGDLPYVGPAFTRYQNTVTKTELLIFLTPHVALQPATLKPMSADELRGTKLTPNAVAPGEFQDHMRGMQRGESGLEPSTRPDVFVPTSQPTSMPNVLSLPFSIPAREPGNGSIEPAEPGGQQPIYVPVPVPVPTGGSGG